MPAATRHRSRQGGAMDDPTALYRYFDDDDRLLYVGIAVEPFRRMAQHRHGKGWWADVARVELERFDTRPAALEAERLAIVNEQPLYNITHSRPAIIQQVAIVLYCQVCEQRIAPGAGYLCVNRDAVRAVREALVAHERRNEGKSSWETIALDDLLSIPDDAPWQAFHAQCDPRPDSNDYWIGAEKITTIQQLLHWNDHLLGKGWVHDCTDWTAMLARSHTATGPLQIETA